MSGQTEKAVGEALHLEAQLYDEETSLPLRIIADILRANGSLITTVELTHTSKGVFVDGSYIMPDELTIFAKYYVYDPDGVTPRTDDYGIIGEKFVKRLNAVVNVIGSPIEGELLVAKELTGDITEICADLEGEIQDIDNLEGELQDIQPLVGEVINE